MKTISAILAVSLSAFLLIGFLVPLTSVGAESSNPFQIRVIAPTLAYPGETSNIFIETTYNGTLTGNQTSVTFHAHAWVNTPTSTGSSITITLLPAPTNYATGHYNTTWAVPGNATIGSVEWIHVPGTYQGVSSTGVAGITIMPQSLFTGTSTTGLGSLQSQVNGLQQNVTKLSGSVEGPNGQSIETSVTIVAAVLGIIGIVIAIMAVRRTRPPQIRK